MGFPGGSDSKESACNVGDLGFIPVVRRSPGERNSTCSSILAWRLSWTEEPGSLQSMGSQRVGHEAKWALESITTNKASGGDGFQLSYFKS